MLARPVDTLLLVVAQAQYSLVLATADWALPLEYKPALVVAKTACGKGVLVLPQDVTK